MRFSEAIPKVISIVASDPDTFPGKGRENGEVTLVRDLYGRIRIALPEDPIDEESRKRLDKLAKTLHRELGPFSPGARQLFLLKKDMFAAAAVFESPDRFFYCKINDVTIFMLDRQAMGREWLSPPLAPARSGAVRRRVAFFGIKGGVGRSTALAVLAWRLARLGQRVLVIDLDLESPGVGSLLLPQGQLPDFGVVDWFVESAVGQADSALVDEMAANSPLIGDADPGEIRVIPAAGKNEQDYLAKLSRAYIEVKSAGPVLHFGERLHNMIVSLETRYQPDVVLLDSRAGMHDIAAVAVARLDALAFLFAVDGAYTWEAYRLLFQHWRKDRNLLCRFRDNLRMVAGLVPETERTGYFDSFRQEAYRLFTDYIYDPTGDGESANEGEEPFSFDLMSVSAPHDFLHVNWNRAFFSFDPVRRPDAVDEGQLQGGFGDFVQRAAEIILGTPVKWS